MKHYGPDRNGVYEQIADVLSSVASVKEQRGQPAPSTAEYLDAIRVAATLQIKPGSPEWKAMITAMFTKPRSSDDAA